MAKTVDIINDRGNQRAVDILEAVQAVSHLVRSRQLQVLRGGPEELTPLETRVLFYFSHHPGGTLGGLTEHSGRDKGQLGRLIGGLRERGWLSAETDENDRRVTRFDLTEQALRRQKSMTSQRSELSTSAIRGLTGAERQQLLTLLERVRENLEAITPEN
ncbi:MAG TPA: MarR family winged helix-turn-helix transcriptional regulator [Polaromonas sp.]|uniref:MarR family winged helix-turn-helix transcriptional regulator n=1 Tax=Polaromonas sp. TaxID=1869339 RepID=UPI002D407736|nr:MarR family winged helix-turn-helix transcriptional regulator [Polaromonas sp.]HYW55394.1 MarR family winged helix-turn-helix transcriptional regulator [Polaromonas sp.]